MRGGKRAGAGRKKGSPNKVNADLMAAARVYTKDALDTIVGIMRKGESDAARLGAAKEMLERGHGKAPQPQTGADGKSPIHHVISWLAPQ